MNKQTKNILMIGAIILLIWFFFFKSDSGETQAAWKVLEFSADPKKPDGSPCSKASECVGGHCSDLDGDGKKECW